MTNPFGPNPFERNPFDSTPPGPPFAPQPPPFAPLQPPQSQPPPAPPRDEANTLATLSVVFAFVFAPVGAILGHLGLSQIRRTGERGRDRALVGLTLSYVFIAVAVVVLVVGALLPDTSPTRVATPPMTTTTPPTPTTTSTTTPPPPPTVAPADVDGLLPNLADVKNITGDPAVSAGRTLQQPTPEPQRGSIDRTECWPVMEAGAPEGYDPSTIVRFSSAEFSDAHDVYNQWVVGAAVATFHDATAAQSQLARQLSVMRQCGGSTLRGTWPNGKTYPVVMTAPADAGNGITTMQLAPKTPVHIFCVQAYAAKANVTIDLQACSTKTANADRSQQAAVDIANLVLGRIPG